MKSKKIAALPLNFSEVLPKVAQRILASCNPGKCFQHLDSSPIPSRNAAAHIIHKARRILFPGYFTQNVLAPSNLEYCLKQEMTELYKALANQIVLATQHDCLRYDQPCTECSESSRKKALEFVQALPRLREVLATDVRAAVDGDPAAKSHDEVITSYPGLFAITVQRIAHELYKLRYSDCRGP
jgi:serine O-acetyltransferase